MTHIPSLNNFSKKIKSNMKWKKSSSKNTIPLSLSMTHSRHSRSIKMPPYKMLRKRIGNWQSNIIRKIIPHLKPNKSSLRLVRHMKISLNWRIKGMRFLDSDHTLETLKKKWVNCLNPRRKKRINHK